MQKLLVIQPNLYKIPTDPDVVPSGTSISLVVMGEPQPSEKFGDYILTHTVHQENDKHYLYVEVIDQRLMVNNAYVVTTDEGKKNLNIYVDLIDDKLVHI